MNLKKKAAEEAAYHKTERLLRNLGLTMVMKGMPYLITLIGDRYLRRLPDGPMGARYRWVAGKYRVDAHSVENAIRSAVKTIEARRTHMLDAVLNGRPEKLNPRTLVNACVDWLDTHEQMPVEGKLLGERYVWRSTDPQAPITITDPLRGRFEWWEL